MQTNSFIWELGRDGGLSINITPSTVGAACLTLELACPITDDRVTIAVFSANRVGFLELLKRVANECLLRVRDKEQTGERDDA